ncbi:MULTISPECIES: HetP family heterocyst commitment protein [Nostocales]|uniref:HetP family heterocyst commitment protein n=3 Tax=Nostocales TaxID=1161 RepID=A0A0C1N572_9CYAN|nr:HetP family heterocyst commitment protein [Tolypothrix bouteillei]KAF3888899.1 HetP family heterocyst commitment protein [Tolypothrix bouteillei VB521301]
MNHSISGSNNLDKTINPEQFDQVVEAILAGKYSWACVLMLRFAGYNPLHYIPYRTYNRLLKENSHVSRANTQSNENLKIAKLPTEKRSSDRVTPTSCLSKIKDLAYLEVVGKHKTEVRGGSQQWLTAQVEKYQSMKSEPEAETPQDLSFKICGFQ